jgi:hypothetical protein
MAKVSKYSILFYSGENNRAQITLADADGNSLAFVRFKDPLMGSLPCICRRRCSQAFSMPSATRKQTSTIRSGAPSCSPS